MDSMNTLLNTANARSGVRRVAGLTAGVGTQALFAFTVVHLFSFLRYGVPQSGPNWLLIDSLLALQFAVPHSWLLHPTTRKQLRPWIGAEFYGAFFCVWTCVSLLVLFHYWQAHPQAVWNLNGFSSAAVLAAFGFSWISLLYSISLTGLGYQTGWTQWLHWWRGEKLPRRDFQPVSLYRWLRHPVYLSFLGLIWFTPNMTLDHVVLTGIWTVYIFCGSALKDQRLEFYLGESYDQYRQQVPGFPFFPGSLLGRRPATSTDLDPETETDADADSHINSAPSSAAIRRAG
ncbi:MAG: hypothetical protein KDA89_20575 [Planctomycetaceae bacterium]|nr:hypothetical protein [Planctomycetaceae bacterium]